MDHSQRRESRKKREREKDDKITIKFPECTIGTREGAKKRGRGAVPDGTPSVSGTRSFLGKRRDRLKAPLRASGRQGRTEGDAGGGREPSETRPQHGARGKEEKRRDMNVYSEMCGIGGPDNSC